MKDDTISADKHALIVPPFMSRGNRVHPMPFTDSSMTCKCLCLGWLFSFFVVFLDQKFNVRINIVVPPRSMDPKKDLAVYGYGTVAWKDRMDEWKRKQNEKLQVVKHQGDKGGVDRDDFEDSDLPK